MPGLEHRTGHLRRWTTTRFGALERRPREGSSFGPAGRSPRGPSRRDAEAGVIELVGDRTFMDRDSMSRGEKIPSPPDLSPEGRRNQISWSTGRRGASASNQVDLGGMIPSRRRSDEVPDRDRKSENAAARAPRPPRSRAPRFASPPTKSIRGSVRMSRIPERDPGCGPGGAEVELRGISQVEPVPLAVPIEARLPLRGRRRRESETGPFSRGALEELLGVREPRSLTTRL